MTGSEIITSVQGLLQDDQFSATQILEAANWLQDKLFGDTDTRIMEASGSLSGTAGNTTIALTGLASTLKKIVTLYQTSPTVLDLTDRYLNHEDFMRKFPTFASAGRSNINMWTQWGTNIRFSAPLLTNVTLPVDYIRRPVPMANEAATCEIPDAHKELISKGTLAYCMQQNEDYGEAGVELTGLNPLILNFKKMEGRGLIKSGPIIMKNNRRRANGGRDAF